jgi:hypothetical protein
MFNPETRQVFITEDEKKIEALRLEGFVDVDPAVEGDVVPTYGMNRLFTVTKDGYLHRLFENHSVVNFTKPRRRGKKS